MATCTVGAHRFEYERVGAGPPLLILNGFSATRLDWDPVFLDALARDHTLFCVDFRGMGGSSDDRPFTVHDLAADVADVVRTIGLDRPAVLGWSMGGFVALTLALAFPQVPSRLVLLATSAGGAGSAPIADAVKARLTDFSGTPRQQASRLLGLLFPPERAAAVEAEFGEVVADARAALPLDVVREQAHLLDEWERSGAGSRLGEVQCPTLVATGSADIVIPPVNAVLLATGITDAWLARFPGWVTRSWPTTPSRSLA
ncbi:MAG TPA: alpha/beta hydrolase [Acidimicrobiia bacterium]